MGIGWQEVLVILVVALLFFGAKRLPELARSAGKSVSEFKKGIKDVTDTASHEDGGKGDQGDESGGKKA